VTTMNGYIGAPGDTGTNTLFGILSSLDVEALEAAIQPLTKLDTESLSNLGNNVEAVVTLLGTTTDTSSSETVFGHLQAVIEYVDTLEDVIGTVEDETTAETVFAELAKLTTIAENVTAAKNSAASALSEAESIRSELGAQGQIPNTYQRLRNMTTALEELKSAANQISAAHIETGELAQEILGTLTNFVNESAKALGLDSTELTIEDLTDEEAEEEENVYEKIDEINAKLAAIKESIEKDEVVVKSWFEGAE